MSDENANSIVGGFALERALVRYDLSVNATLPMNKRLTLNGFPLDLAAGFESLHTEVYRAIMDGRGWGLDDAAPAIALTEQIHRMSIVPEEVTA